MKKFRLRSKSSSSSAHKNNSTRKKDTKSLENLLDDERPIPRYVFTYVAIRQLLRVRFSRPAKFLIIYLFHFRYSLDYEDEQDFDDK